MQKIIQDKLNNLESALHELKKQIKLGSELRITSNVTTDLMNITMSKLFDTEKENNHE